MRDPGAAGRFIGFLAGTETVRYATRQHPIVLVVPLGFATFAAVLLTTALCPVSVVVFLFVTAFVLTLDWWTTHYLLTTHQLVRARLPLWWWVRSLRLTAIESLTLRVDVVGRVIGYGDLLADSAAGQGGRLVLTFLPEPDRWHRQITAAIDEATRA